MSLRELVLINFRNYEYEKIPFFEGCHVFYGPNAQGKTNLLESVYITARGQSFKTTTDRKLIRFGERSAYIRSRVCEAEREKEVEIKFSMVDRKRVRINQVELESAAALAEQFDVVLFAPENLELVQGAPSERRAYMDSILLGTDPAYRSLLRSYEKTVFQRNQLLKTQGAWFLEQLKSYDQQLASAAVALVKKRQALADVLQRETVPLHYALSGKTEQCAMAYRTNCPTEEQDVLEALEETRKRDLEMRNTEIGPHRDELELTINALPARLFASQGQARTLTLACKLAELKLREQKHGHRPLLLLDDVFSELDDKRAYILLELIRPFQSLVTTNEATFVQQEQKDAHFYRVESGKITLQARSD